MNTPKKDKPNLPSTEEAINYINQAETLKERRERKAEMFPILYSSSPKSINLNPHNIEELLKEIIGIEAQLTLSIVRFSIAHPEVHLTRIHDSWVFEVPKDYPDREGIIKEIEQLLRIKEVRPNG